MSIGSVERSLRDFLKADQPQVIALTGKWGSGKTYFWRSFLHKNKQFLPTSRPYSYVSLFGLNSLDQLKDSIFASARIGVDEPTPSSGWKYARERFHAGVRQAYSAIDGLPKIGDFAPLARTIAFSTISGYLVCLDDLERRSRGLPLRDILGLVTMLREEKQCRVIVVLNSDSDALAEKEEFELLREKVFDWELSFAPSPREAASIVFSDQGGVYGLTAVNTVRLGITNIRVLARIRGLVDRVSNHALAASADIQKQIAHSAALLAWSYNSKSDAPPFKLLRGLNYSRFIDLGISGTSKKTDDDLRWDKLLQEYEYTASDDLDVALCDILERGYVDSRALDRVMAERAESVRKTNLEEAFRKSWDVYRYSFNPDPKPVIDALTASFTNGVEVITISSASATAKLIRELGHPEIAEELTALWLDWHSRHNPEALNVREYHWKDEIEPELAQRAQALFDRWKHRDRPLRDVVLALGEQSGWSEGDIRTLLAASVDDYYGVFKTLDGLAMRSGIEACLRFVGLDGNADCVTIGRRALGALTRIAALSPTNMRRVRSYGIDPNRFTPDGEPKESTMDR